MPTHQDGQVIERSGAFYVRYYTNSAEGRKRVAHRLCAKDAKHRSPTAANVKQLADQHMLKVNAEAGAVTLPKSDLSVADFWTKEYLPWLQREKQPSTISGYKKIWKQHLQPHFKQRRLRDYRPSEAFVWLEGLGKTLTRNTVQHIRSLASGIFTRAVNTDFAETNPLRQIKLSGLKAAPPTKHYTLEEAENIITALVSRVDAQAVFALGFFAGLGPAEIAGLRWEDFDADYINIRRNVVNSAIGPGPVKSERRTRSILMIQPVKGLLQLWRVKAGDPSEGWVFPNAKGGPLNVTSFKNIVILPLLEKAKMRGAWKGYYAARRGCGTMLYDLTGDQRAAYQVLGNSLRVLEKHYAKPVMGSGVAGLKLLEGKAAGRSPEPVEGHKS